MSIVDDVIQRATVDAAFPDGPWIAVYVKPGTDDENFSDFTLGALFAEGLEQKEGLELLGVLLESQGYTVTAPDGSAPFDGVEIS